VPRLSAERVACSKRKTEPSGASDPQRANASSGFGAVQIRYRPLQSLSGVLPLKVQACGEYVR
jgi:hypothetical protein